MKERPIATAKAQETRERIYEAALRLFGERGFDETTRRDISAEAGVATGAAIALFAEAIEGSSTKIPKDLAPHLTAPALAPSDGNHSLLDLRPHCEAEKKHAAHGWNGRADHQAAGARNASAHWRLRKSTVKLLEAVLD